VPRDATTGDIPAGIEVPRTGVPGMLAALDLGTNSFHLVVARIRGEGYEIVTREKQTIRLGHGGGDMKELSSDAMERGMVALRRMKRIADSHGAPVRAIATSAVREALNRNVFIRRAWKEAGIRVDIVSGLEEARLIHLGVLQAVPAFDRRLILVDIGGGSTEVLVGERGETLAARSFKLGAVRLTDRFFPGGRLPRHSVDECRSYVHSVIAGFEPEVAAAGFDIAIASSGTAETVAGLVATARGSAPRTLNRFEFTRAELDDVVAALVARRTAQSRAKVRGLDAARADIIVAGALVLQCVAEAFSIPSFTFSESALREGVLLDTISRLRGGQIHHLRDVSRRSVRQLAERCDNDIAHSEHVADLALQLYDDAQFVHHLPRDCRDYLEAAALLANVGVVISHSKHHLHSYYVIRNSELAGLTDNEIEMIALIARYHRKSAPKPGHAEFERLPEEDRNIVRTLSAILRIAIGLDRGHSARVERVRVARRGRRLVIEAVPKDGADIALEVYTAHERRQLLAEVFGVDVEVIAATS
jgi:exopolyphosphatase/guanosine-5'-triphosphate,3'-diphosphate pyrophosphatase